MARSLETSRTKQAIFWKVPLTVTMVGERERFADEGGMLSLIFVDDHLGFNINDDAARDAGISISSNLLKLASAVIRKTDGGG